MLNDIVAWLKATIEQIVYELLNLNIMEWSGTVWIFILTVGFVGVVIMVVSSIEALEKHERRIYREEQEKGIKEKR